MELRDYLKFVTWGVEGLTAWYLTKVLRQRIVEGRKLIEPRAAQPFLRLGFRWVGDLKVGMIHPPEILFHIGNREGRAIYLDQIDWYSPANRLRWDAKVQGISGHALLPGQGFTVTLEPLDTLEPVVNLTEVWGTWLSQMRLICGLRLSVRLQSGEESTIAAPRVLKIYLAHLHRLPLLARGFIRCQSYVRP
ncbi:hypothetical protein [Pseudomonas sp. ICMP 561]|uniref:hypothetical protein n=1 Tax=Pseudomonas sp. ICMP 561 TaxID=1718918 RepID=UPI000C08A9F5|nr:hypothetical protein [Pseudomonas sp. ICMP 561]PHN17211.1 hypothetical protein AO242_21200 [Pseudomonas sp. ICMP 561]